MLKARICDIAQNVRLTIDRCYNTLSKIGEVSAQFKSWLDNSSESVTKESLLGAAITYSLHQWPKLVRYLDDGRLNIDNNRAERAIKPFVIGRKAWLFANTKTGAQASAALNSLVETSKINGVEPYDYLCRLLTELPKANTQEKLQQLLPY